jgi:hypothetical protein
MNISGIPWELDFLSGNRCHYGTVTLTTLCQEKSPRPDSGGKCVWIEAQKERTVRAQFPTGRARSLGARLYFKGALGSPADLLTNHQPRSVQRAIY